MSTQIEKKVPMPQKWREKYPWDKLGVGDRFNVATQASGAVLCDKANRRHAPKRFESRVIEGVTYIWRTK